MFLIPHMVIKILVGQVEQVCAALLYVFSCYKSPEVWRSIAGAMAKTAYSSNSNRVLIQIMERGRSSVYSKHTAIATSILSQGYFFNQVLVVGCGLGPCTVILPTLYENVSFCR